MLGRLTSPTRTSKTTGAGLSADRCSCQNSTTDVTRPSGSLAMTGTGRRSGSLPSRFPHRRNFQVISAAWSTRLITTPRYPFLSQPPGRPILLLYQQVVQAVGTKMGIGALL